MSDNPTTARCPDCGAIGVDYCERATCSWNQWNDGMRVTVKQQADGAAWANAINADIAKRDRAEADYRAEIARWIKEQSP